MIKQNKAKLTVEESDLKDRKRIARDIVTRMKAALKVTKNKDLAERLGLGITVPTAWLGKGHVPAKALDQCSVMTGASLDWLRDGKEWKGGLCGEEVSALQTEALKVLASAVDFGMITEDQENGLSITANKLVTQFIELTGLTVSKKS